jgi:hypothetical protein
VCTHYKISCYQVKAPRNDYKLTAFGTIILEKLIVSQLVKFSVLYGTRTLITVFLTALLHLRSVNMWNSIEASYPYLET